MANVKTFKKGIKLDPQSADPTGTQGQVQFSDGTVRSEGLWQYKGGAWSPIGGGAGSSDTLHLIKAASDSDTDFTIKSIDDLLPDFEATDTLTATFNVPTSGNDALLSDDDAHKVYKFATTTASQYDAVGRSFTIPKAYRGRDILCEFQYRTKDTSGDSVDGDYMTWLYDETNGVKLTASANEAIGQTVLSVSQNPTALETDTFVDGDVSVANDELTLTAHTFKTGDLVQLTTTGTLPAGLALATDYYVINLDANTIGLATSYANALAGTEVDITAAAGGGTHTISKRLPLGTKIWISCDSDVLETHVTAISSTTITVADALVSQWTSGKAAFTGILTDVLTTLNAADSDIAKKGTSFKKYVLVPETCESIAFVVQQLTSQTDSFLYFDNILISGDPFKKVETQGRSAYFKVQVQSNFWDAVTSTLEFDESLFDPCPLTGYTITNNPYIQIVNSASEDRITAKQDIELDINVVGLVDSNGEITIRDSSAFNLSADSQATAGYYSEANTSILLAKDDYITVKNSDPFSTRIGGINLKATPVKGTSIIVESADSVMSEWTDYTPTTQGFGTPTNIDYKYRRVGDSVEIYGRFTAGTTTAVEAQIGLPSGLIIDSTKISSVQAVGVAHRGLNDVTVIEYVPMATGGDSFLNFSRRYSGNNVYSAIANGDDVSSTSGVFGLRATVPIAGWSATNKPLLALPTVTVGQEPENYVVRDALGLGSTNTGCPYFEDEVINTISNLGSITNDSTNGMYFTASTRCKATMAVTITHNGAADFYGISLNGDLTLALTNAANDSARLITGVNHAAGSADTGTVSIIMEPGDILAPHTNGAALSTTEYGNIVSLMVEPIIGQQNMAAIISQPVAYVKYVLAASSDGGGATSGSWQDRPLNTLAGDIAEVGVSLASNIFTLPAGKYDIEAGAMFKGTNRTKLQLLNNTDSIGYPEGHCSFFDNTYGVQGEATLKKTITITKQTDFKLRYYVQTTVATNGLGIGTGGGTGEETFVTIKIARKK